MLGLPAIASAATVATAIKHSPLLAYLDSFLPRVDQIGLYIQTGFLSCIVHLLLLCYFSNGVQLTGRLKKLQPRE